jgi:hypothetical protein
MSRGLGRVEQAVLAAIRDAALTRTAAIAAYAFVVQDEAKLTASQLASTRRALRRLKARGEIVVVPLGLATRPVEEQLIKRAIQYYAAARQSAWSGLLLVCGNLYHHALVV